MTSGTEGKAGHQLVQPGGQLAVHVHLRWADVVAQHLGHIRGPGGKSKGEN